MSEETDALSNRIRQLESQVADMQRLVQDTSDLLDIARANGLDKFLTGHGLMEYGGGVDRLDTTGIQIKSDGLTTGIRFVSEFATSFDESVVYKAGKLTGGFNGTNSIVDLVCSDGVWQTQLELTNATAELVVFGSFIIRGESDNSTYTRAYTEVPFGFASVTGDFSLGLLDGQIWYRSDTDKFRARINGATENLATESYVAANAPTGFADAFLVMGG